MRRSEIMGTDPLKFDSVKTLLGADVKVLKADVEGNQVQILQMRLKQPKTQ